MPSIESMIHINRTPHEVFGFVSDYERDPEWRSDVVEITFQDPGPTRTGRRVLEKLSSMGLQLVTLSEVTEYEPDAKIVSRSISGPTPVIAYRFVTTDGQGARFTYRLDVDLSKVWYFRMLSAILVPRYQKTIASYLERLKQLLESDS